MKEVAFTEFRQHASELFTDVEKGEIILVTRHGKPVAEIIPFSEKEAPQVSWKKPGIKLAVRGKTLSSTIIKERSDENIL